MDEFEFIARVLRPLAAEAPEALELRDDAAVIPCRSGQELVVTVDTIVEGVHFLPGDVPELVAAKLLRVNLSDLAAKAAEPYAYFLSVCWPSGWEPAMREQFVRGLAREQALFGLKLFGGDTTSTPCPFTATVTMLGWAPEGRMVRRSGARAGDLVLVSGTVGDGWLGLEAARAGLAEISLDGGLFLSDRYRLPRPRLGLREAMRRHASAAADVSDGLLADAAHIAEASGVGLRLELDGLPLSEAAREWLGLQPDRAGGLAALAAGGDDYEVVCTAPRGEAEAFQAVAAEAGVPLAIIGEAVEGAGLEVRVGGASIDLERLGWRHE